MASLLARWKGERSVPVITTIDDYAELYNQFVYSGIGYSFGGLQQTLAGQTTEQATNTFAGLAAGAFGANGVVFSCMLVRQLVFSSVRFRWQRLRDGKPSDTFGTPDLALLERPWVGGTTQDLLSRMIQDADLAGNSYWIREGDQLVRLRPDWVDVVVEPLYMRDGRGQIGWTKVGYLYTAGGTASGSAPVGLLADEVVHFAPIPDPLANFRGMSWLTPILREIAADQSMTQHQRKFFDNGATVNLVIKHDVAANEEKVRRWAEQMQERHGGVRNAYKALHLYPGADATAIGSNLKDIDFKSVRGGGEPLALDTPIPTPSGWTTMGAIEVGDEVIGRDGLPAVVTAVSPVHHGRDCYRITFNDRSTIVADAGHLWTAMNRSTNARAEEIFTTEQIGQLIAEWKDRGNGGNRFGVPAAAAVKLPDRDLLVDPYVLGVWLGDGQTAGAAIAGAAEDLAFIAGEIRRAGYTVTEWSTKPDKASVIGLPGGFLAALDALGVLGDKHIPAEFLRASHSQRLELLRGLMDTDGTVGHIGHETCEFSSKLESLARQVAELARSLGQRVTVSCKREPRSRTGETWRVTWRADPEMAPFRMPRKVARCVTPLHTRHRAIVSVEPVESVPVRCITVDTPDHLFCAGEGWILTHNTRIAAAAGVPPVIVGLSEGLAAATYCLPCDSLVWTSAGPKPISAVRAGDIVWSYGDGTLRERPVTWQGAVGEKELYRIQTKNRVLRATGNHPVLVHSAGEGMEWRRVDELQIGDAVVQVLALPGGGGVGSDLLGCSAIRDIALDGVETVYDLTVDEDHSFIADGVVVHNSNYGQARRRLADGTAHPLWQNVAGSMELIIPRPGRGGGQDVRLWYDATDVPFLREDEADAATIAETRARTIEAYIRAGYEPSSVVAAVNANDLRLLTHTGLYSVQLQKPGSQEPAPPEPAPDQTPNQGEPDDDSP